MIMKIGFL